MYLENLISLFMMLLTWKEVGAPLCLLSSVFFSSSAHFFMFWIRTYKNVCLNTNKYILKPRASNLGPTQIAVPNFKRSRCPETSEYKHI